MKETRAEPVLWTEVSRVALPPILSDAPPILSDGAVAVEPLPSERSSPKRMWELTLTVEARAEELRLLLLLPAPPLVALALWSWGLGLGLSKGQVGVQSSRRMWELKLMVEVRVDELRLLLPGPDDFVLGLGFRAEAGGYVLGLGTGEEPCSWS